MPDSGSPSGGAASKTQDPTERTREDLFRELEHLKELLQAEDRATNARIDSQKELTEALFRASTENVATAFTAAKEAVGKQEADTSKRLEGLQTMLHTMENGLARRLEDLKERMDLGRGGSERMSAATATILAVGGLLVAIAAIAVAVFLNK